MAKPSLDGGVTHYDVSADLQFDIELVTIVELPGPVTGQPQRPYGSLERRLRNARTVVEYTEGLVHDVQHPED
ncbi:hypothetical protein [Nocardioides sp. InS609-2]|uniref:hypothetical protein n=1 Tax=Nocardioides sp. InS609-2 TaxID=2760705 RepID=UPI0020C021CE|nr:hypothetical protein [Nocardioides sp. InS609-2]